MALEIVFCESSEENVVKGTSKEKKRLKGYLKRRGIKFGSRICSFKGEKGVCSCMTFEEWISQDNPHKKLTFEINRSRRARIQEVIDEIEEKDKQKAVT